MKLLFYVNNQSLSLSQNQKNIKIVSDSKNHLIAKFIFQTEDWNTDRVKYALFSHNGKTYKRYLGVDAGLQDNECYVAPEVIKAGEFTVSVFCEEYITTHTVSIPVEQSGYTEEIENEPTTPTVMEQMNTMLYKYATLCNDILKECQKIKEEMEVKRDG